MKNFMTMMAAVTFTFVANAAVASSTSNDGSYITVGIAPLCTAEGQITLSFTNVSGQHLLVDPHYMDKSKFDPIYAGLSLYTDPEGQAINLKYKAKPNYEQYDWYVLKVGETVEHIVDFRGYATTTIDETLHYAPLFSGNNINLITTNKGKEIRLFMHTDDESDFDIFGPECWK
ncbi:hypothetical protein FM038_020020 [Shewanella eurypsychrophilus]|uniref:Uncharacterized protein n=1 Tax=Shewanella eurypsychrophilus TaxID=2593656 RepID=A0ABX6V9R4_9GAMM|nr:MULTISPECIES: hypothetical protein [Shewanella]QFU24212.1 hypothetical protein FS418_21745 [Shewanella sp. YLB-09]QPG59417.1 hypothetical protein FM038_020020 [Shewanella eurypsychrophilus]